MRIKQLFIAVALVALLSSCATSGLYSWYHSQETFYTYQKKATDKSFNAAIKEYQKLIGHQSGERQTVPPGAMAEYGYMLYKSGQVAEGVKYLKKEIDLYPESEIFISRVIQLMEK